MLSHLLIKDFATIESLETDFHRGLNIITGETGAGKSVVISAISMVLGARADTAFVRTGCEKAVIQLMVETLSRDILLTREIHASGKSLCKIDDRIVTLGELRALAVKLADIHGQYEHQYLLDTSNHIKLVDLYEKDNIETAKKRVKDLYQEYKERKSDLEILQAQVADNEEKKEQLRFEIDEIKNADLSLNEDLMLAENLEELKHSEEIYAAVNSAYGVAKGMNGNPLDGLYDVITELKPAASLSKDISFFEDEVSDLYYRFEDVCTRMRQFKDTLTTSPEEIERIADRLDTINQLKRKYGNRIDTILDHAEAQEKELHRLTALDTDIESALLEFKTVEDILHKEVENLTALRRVSAQGLEAMIQKELLNLGFNKVIVSVKMTKKENLTAEGIDDIEFMISTNAGEDLKPLAKIVSGGEMSRIMLAFKKIISEFDNIPTLIFDEIDTGISGETARIVGKTIKQLASEKQVITITHLPQIAAYGDQNYRIEKSSDDNSTYTTIKALSEDEKAAEIARLIAGLNISDLTLQSALEMIAVTKQDD